MSAKQKLVIFLVVVALAGIIGYFVFGDKEARKPIELNGKNQSLPAVSKDPANSGPVGAISGVSCENWNRRPVGVMQPVEPQTRPIAGFFDTDMVFEMPNPAEGIFVTRLIGFMALLFAWNAIISSLTPTLILFTVGWYFVLRKE